MPALSHRAIGISVSVTAAVLLAGCGLGTAAPTSSHLAAAEPNDPNRAPGSCTLDASHAIAIVASGRSNEPAPELSSAGRALIGQAFDTHVWVTVVSTSNVPAVVAEGPVATDAANSAAIADDRLRAPAIVQAAMRAHPVSGEADLIGAMTLAGRWLVGHGGKTLIVQDSGLSTTGPLDYRAAGMLGAEPGDVAGYLSATHSLPELAGLTVVLTGLGDTAAPQQPLPEATRRDLTDQYRAIALKAGAACVMVDQTPTTGAATSGAPRVSLIVPPAQPVWSGNRTTDVVLNDDVLGFLPGTAQLRDPDTARALLASIAASIKHSHAHVVLTGTTADWGSPAYQLKLSRARAEAIRQVLVTAGVDSTSISTRGMGSSNPWHIVDRDALGHLLPGPASRNRTVRISAR